MATKSRFRGKYVSVNINDYVDVPLDDILEGMDDEALKAAYSERFGSGANDYDTLSEIEWFLLRGQPQAALALVQSVQNASMVRDDYRQKQLLQMRAAEGSVQ